MKRRERLVLLSLALGGFGLLGLWCVRDAGTDAIPPIPVDVDVPTSRSAHGEGGRPADGPDFGGSPNGRGGNLVALPGLELPREFETAIQALLAGDDASSTAIRRARYDLEQAIRAAGPRELAAIIARVGQILERAPDSEDAVLGIIATTLGQRKDEVVSSFLLALAGDRSLPEWLRRFALEGLTMRPPSPAETLGDRVAIWNHVAFSAGMLQAMAHAGLAFKTPFLVGDVEPIRSEAVQRALIELVRRESGSSVGPSAVAVLEHSVSEPGVSGYLRSLASGDDAARENEVLREIALRGLGASASAGDLEFVADHLVARGNAITGSERSALRAMASNDSTAAKEALTRILVASNPETGEEAARALFARPDLSVAEGERILRGGDIPPGVIRTGIRFIPEGDAAKFDGMLMEATSSRYDVGIRKAALGQLLALAKAGREDVRSRFREIIADLDEDEMVQDGALSLFDYSRRPEDIPLLENLRDRSPSEWIRYFADKVLKGERPYHPRLARPRQAEGSGDE